MSEVLANWLALPRTRKEAIACGSKKYFTNIPCKEGHISPRMASERCHCCECLSVRAEKLKHRGCFISKNNPEIFGKKAAESAWSKGENKYYPNIPCHKGHIGARYSSPGAKSRCVVCFIEKSKRKIARDREFYPYKAAIRNIKGDARKRGAECNLTQEWAQKRWTGFCEITGIPMRKGKDPNKNGPRFDSPSIDRIDPKIGYLQDNCRFVLFCVNAFKGTGTDEEMIFVAKKIIERRENGQF